MKLVFTLNTAITRLEIAAGKTQEDYARMILEEAARDLKEAMTELAPAWGELTAAVERLEKGGR